MSLVASDEHGCVLDHKLWINETIMHVGFKCKESMFDIDTQFRMDSEIVNSDVKSSTESSKSTTDRRRKKRKKLIPNQGESAANAFHVKAKQVIEKAFESLKNRIVTESLKEDISDSNNEAYRKAGLIEGPGEKFVILSLERVLHKKSTLVITESDNHIEEIPANRLVICTNNQTKILEIGDVGRFLIPPKTRFLLSDISRVEPLVDNKEIYNLIVMDPPWENKSVKRKRTYNSMRNEDLLEIPMRDLMDRNGCLVAVWATNRQQQHRFVKEEMFPFWDITYHTTWFWLKTTKFGGPVLPLDGSRTGKKPYECLILGFYGEKSFEIPKEYVLVSVPSAVHSCKPPLYEVLTQYVGDSPRPLELFARNLQPGWTSWGNQVLLHTSTEFFDEEQNT